jgi:hypothetical protein
MTRRRRHLQPVASGLDPSTSIRYVVRSAAVCAVSGALPGPCDGGDAKPAAEARKPRNARFSQPTAVFASQAKGGSRQRLCVEYERLCRILQPTPSSRNVSVSSVG